MPATKRSADAENGSNKRAATIAAMTSGTPFSGKAIALTGAASGIGLATTRHLAALGASLSLADMNGTALSALEADLARTYPKQTFHSAVVNVVDRAAVTTWLASATEVLGGALDGAVNLAGVIGKDINVAEVSSVDDDDWDFVMGVNLRGTLNCLRAEIPLVRDGGAIVNTASVAGLIGFVKNAAYVCSKHAVVGLTKTAAKELGGRGVRVNAIAP